MKWLILSLLITAPWAYADPVAVCAVGDGANSMIIYAKDNTTGVTLPITYRALVGIPSGQAQAYCITLSPHSINATLSLNDARAWMEAQ